MFIIIGWLYQDHTYKVLSIIRHVEHEYDEGSPLFFNSFDEAYAWKTKHAKPAFDYQIIELE